MGVIEDQELTAINLKSIEEDNLEKLSMATAIGVEDVQIKTSSEMEVVGVREWKDEDGMGV
jgi:hypothetical protein